MLRFFNLFENISIVCHLIIGRELEKMTYTGSLLKISDDQNEYAKMGASKMSHPLSRKRGMIDLIGITSAVNWFLAGKIKVQVSKSLHKIPRLLEEFKITDIYYNNYRIDVITVFREKTIKVPRIHSELDILPHFYLVVQIGAMLKETKIIGYLNPTDVISSKKDNKFFYPPEDKLKSAEDLKKLIKIPGPLPAVIGKHLECMSLFLRFIDNELSTSYKKMLIQHLLTCETCTKKLVDVIEFDNAAKNAKAYPRTIEKYYNKYLLHKKQGMAADSKVVALPSAPSNAPVLPRKNSVTGMLSKASLNQDAAQDTDNVVPMMSAAQRAAQRFKKNTIDYIFRDRPEFEGSGDDVVVPPRSKKKKIAAMALCALILVGIAGFAITRQSGSSPDPIANADEYTAGAELPFDESQGELDGTTEGLPEDFYNSTSGYYGKGNDYALASEANGEPIIATINKVSWEVPENLADKSNYKKFLQLVGKNIKLNLQNDLLLSNETAKSSLIKVDIKFGHNGDIQSLKIAQTSGSSQIDEIIKKSVRETLSYMKPPQSGFGTKSAEITLVIEL